MYEALSDRRGGPRIALVHDYLVQMRGGERVFKALADMFPDSDIFTFLYRRGEVAAHFQGRSIQSSFIQRLPFAASHYRACFALYPIAARLTKLEGYDLVISSSSAWAHAVSAGGEHISYCYSPFRYIWSHYDLLAERFGRLAVLADPLRRLYCEFDRAAAQRVSRYVAISKVVQARIRRYYGRASEVIYPPVELARFTRWDGPVGNYFLVVSALKKYKRLDLVVRACTLLRMPLKVVGTGEEEATLRAIAGPTVEFLGNRTDLEVAELYAGCRAFVFPSEDDFGIAPLEAMASGRPVIAYGAGGALETVVGGVTGTFFAVQDVDVVADTLNRHDGACFDAGAIRAHAETFGLDRFQEQIRSSVRTSLQHDRSEIA